MNSTYTASQAVTLWGVMDANDKIYVVDATNNVAAWQNLSTEAADFIKDKWLK